MNNYLRSGAAHKYVVHLVLLWRRMAVVVVVNFIIHSAIVDERMNHIIRNKDNDLQSSAVFVFRVCNLLQFRSAIKWHQI